MKKKNENPLLKLFEAVSYLHRLGYENLRLMSYFSPSGMHFRCVLSIKDNFDRKTGFICKENETHPIYRYSTSQEFRFFNNKSFLTSDAAELAKALFEEYPELEKLSKGSDSEYVKWFDKVVELAKKDAFPYAFSDYGYDIFEANAIKLTNGKWIEYAPPGSY